MVSNLGRVKSMILGGRVLNGHIDKDGYRRVRLDGRQERVHRLVCEAYHGPPPEGFEVCHSDGSRTNNRADNLRWGSKSENVRDSVAHGTHRYTQPPNETRPRGEKNRSSKLTDSIVAECRHRHANGESGRSLAAEFGVGSASMSRALRGETWTHLPLPAAPNTTNGS